MPSHDRAWVHYTSGVGGRAKNELQSKGFVGHERAAT
jgi:hypothetical protein